jgi:hypothetical protein
MKRRKPGGEIALPTSSWGTCKQRPSSCRACVPPALRGQDALATAGQKLALLVTRLLSSYGSGQSCAQLIRLETKRAWFALVGDAAVGVNQIKAVGPACIGPLRSVAKLIKNAGNFYAELSHAGSGNIGAFFFVLRIGKDDLVLYVALHLPDVARMGLGDVDNQKSHAVLVLLVKFVEGRNLPPERRSRIAAENQHHGLLLIQGGELNLFGLVDLKQGEIRRGITDLQSSGAGVKPSGLEWEQEKGNRPGQSFHYPAEGFRGLIHSPPNNASESGVNHRQHDRNHTQSFAGDGAQFKPTLDFIPSHNRDTLIARSQPKQ